MKLITAIFIFSVFTSYGQSTPGKAVPHKKIIRNVEQDINSLIPSGEITVDIMDQVTMSPRRKELQGKFAKAMKENTEWFLEQQQVAEKSGRGLYYDPRLGMTEEEWNEYKIIMKDMSDMKAASSGTSKITVTKKNGIISFKADGSLSYLNSTIIDTKNNVVKVFNYTLNPMDTICVTSSDNVFKSTWRGYQWQFSEPLNAALPPSKEDLEHYSMKLYKLTLGLFAKTGKTLMEISGGETAGGKETIRYKIPIVF